MLALVLLLHLSFNAEVTLAQVQGWPVPLTVLTPTTCTVVVDSGVAAVPSIPCGTPNNFAAACPSSFLSLGFNAQGSIVCQATTCSSASDCSCGGFTASCLAVKGAVPAVNACSCSYYNPSVQSFGSTCSQHSDCSSALGAPGCPTSKLECLKSTATCDCPPLNGVRVLGCTSAGDCFVNQLSCPASNPVTCAASSLASGLLFGDECQCAQTPIPNQLGDKCSAATASYCNALTSCSSTSTPGCIGGVCACAATPNCNAADNQFLAATATCSCANAEQVGICLPSNGVSGPGNCLNRCVNRRLNDPCTPPAPGSLDPCRFVQDCQTTMKPVCFEYDSFSGAAMCYCVFPSSTTSAFARAPSSVAVPTLVPVTKSTALSASLATVASAAQSPAASPSIQLSVATTTNPTLTDIASASVSSGSKSWRTSKSSTNRPTSSKSSSKKPVSTTHSPSLELSPYPFPITRTSVPTQGQGRISLYPIQYPLTTQVQASQDSVQPNSPNTSSPDQPGTTNGLDIPACTSTCLAFQAATENATPCAQACLADAEVGDDAALLALAAEFGAWQARVFACVVRACALRGDVTVQGRVMGGVAGAVRVVAEVREGGGVVVQDVVTKIETVSRGDGENVYASNGVGWRRNSVLWIMGFVVGGLV
ncbi:hypothetical protein BC830DRAFT_1126818 [Chytriomyces sp. MP71]|nr:hypothetical protein BC830DRAFT_1126818 [Chytriomyces sp. MP71]